MSHSLCNAMMHLCLALGLSPGKALKGWRCSVDPMSDSLSDYSVSQQHRHHSHLHLLFNSPPVISDLPAHLPLITWLAAVYICLPLSSLSDCLFCSKTCSCSASVGDMLPSGSQTFAHFHWLLLPFLNVILHIAACFDSATRLRMWHGKSMECPK